MPSILDEDYLEEKKKNKAPVVADFGTRVWAYIVDGAVFILPSILILYNMFEWKIIELFILLSLVNLLYKPFMEWKFGATLGKMALKIKVVDEKNKNITLQHALNRNVVFFANDLIGIIGGLRLFFMDDFAELNEMADFIAMQQAGGSPAIDQLVLFTLMVSCFVAALDLKKQALHDKFAGTLVVKEVIS